MWIMNAFIELYLMEMLWTCLWSFWKEMMALLMLKILHTRVSILSDFLHIHIHFKNTWIWMFESLILVKWYMKELIYPITINYSYYDSSKTKPNNNIASLRKIINGDVNMKCPDSNDVVPSSLGTIVVYLHLCIYMYQHKNMKT